MDVTKEIRKLEAAGYTGVLLDRAVALAGSRRTVYRALCSGVVQWAMTPSEVLREVEQTLEAGNE